MTIIHADVLKWAATYDGPKFHALLTDPPYHLTSIVERFGKAGSAPAQGDVYARSAKGFMGKDWDGGDIAFRPETWAALAEHLYPGAWGMAFAGSRGWHRMAVAIEGLVGVPITSLKSISDLLGLAIETRRWDLVELAKREVDGYLRLTGAMLDAGLIMQPTIFGWGYGSGFPKATNIAAQIDDMAFREWLALHPDELARLATARAEAKRLKADPAHKAEALAAHKHATQIRREIKALAGFAKVIGTKRTGSDKKPDAHTLRLTKNTYKNDDGETVFDVLDCATEAARDWLGHRYGGQCLKPALEPIIVFQKPYQGRPIDNITSSGAGALWIDGGRIASDEETSRMLAVPSGPAAFGYSAGGMGGTGHDAGRWPANLVLSHAPSCNGVCADGCPVRRLGEQSGDAKGGGSINGRPVEFMAGNGAFGDRDFVGYDDSGTAARFFHQADYMVERLELADAISYIAKSSRAEREAGLDPRQTAIMRLLDDDGDDFEGSGGVYQDQKWANTNKIRRCPEHDASQPSGSNHYRCGCRLQFKTDFTPTTVDDGRAIPIDNAYQRGETTRRNSHPTIKPISLARHLATLLLPPASYGPRRLLVPFSGAGSEVIGADLAGWEAVTAVELEADHVAIANARRAYWQQRRWELGDPARKLTVNAAPATPKEQLDMFMEEVTK